MNMYDSKKGYCLPKKYVLNGKEAYITDVVKRGDFTVFKRGFSSGIVFPYESCSDLTESIIQNDSRDYLPKDLNIIDLITYGNIEQIKDMFVSDWFIKYRFVDGEELKINYDCMKRFGGVYVSRIDQTILPLIRIINEEVFFCLYSVDYGMIFLQERLEDVCYNLKEFEKYKKKISDVISHKTIK